MTVLPVTGMGEVRPGDDPRRRARRPGSATTRQAQRAVPGGLVDGDVLVVTQKVVSKAEGRLVDIDTDDPDAKSALVEQESVRIVRRRGDLADHRDPPRLRLRQRRRGPVQRRRRDRGSAAPSTPIGRPDESGRAFGIATGCRWGCVVSDTFGRTWRRGVIDVAIGVAGIAGVVDLRGTADANGRLLEATEVCVADELAGAAELVMGKDRGIPAAVLRGVDRRLAATGLGGQPRSSGRPPRTCSAETTGPVTGPVGSQPASNRSTTNTSVSLGPMTPPAPCSP